ncbi:MAG: hypothetical protein ACRDCE_00875 [Cetobacterium sp.]|uniref:hypothetical protein n=1 Tax=Cetobacterium sp. TaxID=2071632 RepID=UPI003EE77AE7
MALKFKLNIQLFAEEGEENIDNGNDSTVDTSTSSQTGMEETVTERSVFDLVKEGEESGEGNQDTDNPGEDSGDTENNQEEITYNIDKIDGLSEEQLATVRDTPEFKDLVDNAKKLGMTEEAFKYMAGTIMNNSIKMIEAHRNEILEINQPKAVIFERLSDVARNTIKNGQLENYLIKVSGDDTILERVNKAFNNAEQYEILSMLSKGNSNSQPGIDGDKSLAKGYTTKQQYFDDLKVYQNIENQMNNALNKGEVAEHRRLKLEREQLLADIKEKKKYGISSIFA